MKVFWMIAQTQSDQLVAFSGRYYSLAEAREAAEHTARKAVKNSEMDVYVMKAIEKYKAECNVTIVSLGEAEA